MDIKQVITAASRDPRFQQALAVAQQELGDASPEQIGELIQLIELALQRPNEYAQIRQAAIADDMVEPDDLPEQFDATLLASVLVVLYRLREGGSEPQAAMARGGLTRARTLARQGRLGDTMLAHISPEEAAMLRARGGAGTINPNTGLPQFFSLKNIFKAVLPIALTFIAPGLGTAIGSTLLGAGASAAASAALGGAVLGGLSAGLTGGNILQGALFGGLGGGLGGMVGETASKTLGLGLGQTGQAVLGEALVGGVGGMASGQGFLKGAAQGALGAGVGQAAGQFAGPGAVGAGISQAGQQFGNALAAGYDPKTAAGVGALSGLAAGMTYKAPTTVGGTGLKPSDTVVDGLKMEKLQSSPVSGDYKMNYLTGQYEYAPAATAPTDYSLAAPATATPGIEPGTTNLTGPGMQGQLQPNLPNIQGTATVAPSTGMPSMANLGKMAVIGSMLSSSMPQQAANAVQQLTPEQREIFNRPGVSWDWGKMQADAAAANMSLAQYMASYWPQITGYSQGTTDARQGSYVGTPPGGMARGGALNGVARLARGSGSGRADVIDARLSDGEYVMDAETVALLGDGSTDEGARRLDAMRAQLRKHKGRTLARGKFSPNAKSPLAYLKGAV